MQLKITEWSLQKACFTCIDVCSMIQVWKSQKVGSVHLDAAFSAGVKWCLLVLACQLLGSPCQSESKCLDARSTIQVRESQKADSLKTLCSNDLNTFSGILFHWFSLRQQMKQHYNFRLTCDSSFGVEELEKLFWDQTMANFPSLLWQRGNRSQTLGWCVQTAGGMDHTEILGREQGH